MIDFAALLSSTSAAIGVAKAVSEAKGAYDQADLKLQMAEILSTLADVKIALAEAQSEGKAKDDEISRLKEAFAFQGTVVEYYGWKFPATKHGEPYGTPFCPRCIEKDGRFTVTRPTGNGYAAVSCPMCSTKYHCNATLISKEEIEASHEKRHGAKPDA